MKEIFVRIEPMTEDIFRILAKENLIQAIKPSKEVCSTQEDELSIEPTYSTKPEFGQHILITVGFNQSTVNLAYHSEKEIFLLMNEGRQQKPLILLIALHEIKKFQKLLDSGKLSPDDLLAVELEFNNPSLSFFVMNPFIPHCEWNKPGPDNASVFYVIEPASLDVQKINMSDYEIKLI